MMICEENIANSSQMAKFGKSGMGGGVSEMAGLCGKPFVQ